MMEMRLTPSNKQQNVPLGKPVTITLGPVKASLSSANSAGRKSQASRETEPLPRFQEAHSSWAHARGRQFTTGGPAWVVVDILVDVSLQLTAVLPLPAAGAQQRGHGSAEGGTLLWENFFLALFSCSSSLHISQRQGCVMSWVVFPQDSYVDSPKSRYPTVWLYLEIWPLKR